MQTATEHSDEISFSIVTVNYNNSELLQQVLDRTLERLESFSFEVIVVDNGSTDGSYERLSHSYRDSALVHVHSSGRNGGFGFGCNYGARVAKHSVLWFLNSDAWVSSAEGMMRALRLATRPGMGMVGTSVSLADGVSSPQGGSDMSFGYFLIGSFRPGMMFRKLPAAVRSASLRLLPLFPGAIGKYASSFSHSAQLEPYESRGVGGASFLVSRSSFLKLHGFDEGFFLYDEDGDLCLRCIENRLVNYVEPTVQVLTYPSATTSRVSSELLKRIKRTSRLRLIRRHFSGLQKYILVVLTLLTWRLL